MNRVRKSKRFTADGRTEVVTTVLKYIWEITLGYSPTDLWVETVTASCATTAIALALENWYSENNQPTVYQLRRLP